MDLSRSRSRRVKITYSIHWPQEKNGGHLLAPNAARELGDGRVVSVGKDTTIRMWKRNENNEFENAKTYYCHTDSVNDVDVMNSVSSVPLIATGGNDYRISIVDGSRTTPVAQFSEHSDAVKRVRFALNNTLVSAGLEGRVCLFDLQRRQCVSKINFETGFFAMAIQPAASRAMLGDMKGALYTVDTREASGKGGVYQLLAHNGTVRDIAFVDDVTFATGGSDGVVKLWDLRSPRQSYKINCHLHKEPIFSLAARGPYVLSGSRDGQVLLTDPQNKQTVTAIQMNYPIFDVSWNAASSMVTVCSTKPHIELFTFSTCFDDELNTPFQTPTNSSQSPATDHQGVEDTDNALSSPSNVEALFEEHAESLIHIEGRKFGRSTYRDLKHSSKKAEKLWCTSVALPRISDTEFSLGDGKTDFGKRSKEGLSPIAILRGSDEGFVCARLLSDKRHALAMTAKGNIELWNIVEMKQIKEGPHTAAQNMREAVKLCGPYAFGASWCRIDCAWGALRITLSHDEAFNAQANYWEYKYLSSIANTRSTLSVYNFTVADRRKMERTIMNVGEEMLRKWHKEKAEVLVVQTRQNGSDNSTSSSSNASSLRTQFTDSQDGKIPTWALTCLSSGPSVKSNVSGTANVNVQLEPYENSGKLKTISISVPKTKSVADLCFEVMAQNKMNTLNVSDLEDYCLKSPLSVAASPDEQIEFIAVANDILADGDEDGGNNSDSDNGSERCASPTLTGGSLSEKIERIVDPLLMVVTAFYTYKERGSGTLRLKYRTRKGTRVRVEDL